MRFNTVKDLSNSFNPCPKCGQKVDRKVDRKKEKDFCIMLQSNLYKTKRENGLDRHEVYFGTANRKLSIEDGLVVFLPKKLHNMSNKGVHFNKKFDNKLKKIAKKAWMDYYKKTEEEFIKRYGKATRD